MKTAVFSKTHIQLNNTIQHNQGVLHIQYTLITIKSYVLRQKKLLDKKIKEANNNYFYSLSYSYNID